jgi:uncharacterized membrane protein
LRIVVGSLTNTIGVLAIIPEAVISTLIAAPVVLAIRKVRGYR